MLAKTEIHSLVILIDDLDRCLPERIIETLEAIKLFVAVEKTAFVIGADPHYHALVLYESLGFKPVERVAGAYLQPPQHRA